MEKAVEKVSVLTEEFANELYYDREEIINEYSYDLGKKERNIEIAKKMLKNNKDISEIMEYTELSKEEIYEIINENNYD